MFFLFCNVLYLFFPPEHSADVGRTVKKSLRIMCSFALWQTSLCVAGLIVHYGLKSLASAKLRFFAKMPFVCKVFFSSFPLDRPKTVKSRGEN